MDSVTEQMPEFYARMGFSRTAKNGWSGEFTVSIRGPVWDMKQMEAFTAEARQRMLDEIDLLNKITGTGE